MFSGRPVIGVYPASIRYLDLERINRRAGTPGFPIYTPQLSSEELRKHLDRKACEVTTSMEKLRILKKENLYAQLDSVDASQEQKHLEFKKMEAEGLERLAAFTGLYESTNNPNLSALSKFCLLDNYMKNLRAEINAEEIKFKLTEAYRKAREVLHHVNLIVDNPADAERRLKQLNLYFANNEMANIQNMIKTLNQAIDKGIKARNTQTQAEAATQAKRFEAEIIAEETTETLYNRAISLWSEVYSVSKDEFNAAQDFEALEIAKNSLNVFLIKKLIWKLDEQKRDINKTLYSAYEEAINILKEIAEREQSEEKARNRFNGFDSIYKTKDLKKILLAVNKLRDENAEIFSRELVRVSDTVVSEMKENDKASDIESGYEASDEAESNSSFRDVIDPLDLVDEYAEENEEAIAESRTTQTEAAYGSHSKIDCSDAIEVELMPMRAVAASYIDYISGSQSSAASSLGTFGSSQSPSVDFDAPINEFQFRK